MSAKYGVPRIGVIICGSVALACGGGDDDSRTAAAPPLDCGVGQTTTLTDSGIGALRVGATIERIRSHCQVLLDTTLAQGAEGMPERRMTVVLGSVSTTATIADGRVWRIEIASERFRTADSLGVGSTMRRLRRTDARLALGEGVFVLRPDHCGLSFELEALVGQYRRLSSVPDSVRVRRVLVVGCG